MEFYRMNIVICGYGFVGAAHAEALGDKHTVHIYDPHKGYGKIGDKTFDNAQAVIIAVSTPEGETGECDMSNVYDCIERITPGTPVLIKSTISLEGWRLIKRAYPEENISFSPEYLRAKHAAEDFKAQTHIEIGGDGIEFWVHLLSKVLDVEWNFVDPEVLIISKYARNSFLALKVAYCNQLYDLCEATGIDYHSVMYYTGKDKRIGYSHSQIMEDGQRGFGGHCLPKDTSALLATGHGFGTDISILSEAMQYNERLKLVK
jgi:UDPglucose 6-dehydrogenase